MRVSAGFVRYGFVMLSLISRDVRTTLSGFAAAALLAAGAVAAPVAGADPNNADQPGVPHLVGAAPAPVEAPDAALDIPGDLPSSGPEVVPVAHVGTHPRALPPGVGSEEGLQVETIRVERNICAQFPQIRNIIGVRPDSKPWHPSGRAIDIMIPDAGSDSGIALGDAIRDFALRNAADLGVMDVIWRGTYYTPAGPGGGNYGHYDHVHITTFGGGYPGGAEEYLSEG